MRFFSMSPVFLRAIMHVVVRNISICQRNSDLMFTTLKLSGQLNEDVIVPVYMCLRLGLSLSLSLRRYAACARMSV